MALRSSSRTPACVAISSHLWEMAPRSLAMPSRNFCTVSRPWPSASRVMNSSKASLVGMSSPLRISTMALFLSSAALKVESSIWPLPVSSASRKISRIRPRSSAKRFFIISCSVLSCFLAKTNVLSTTMPTIMLRRPKVKTMMKAKMKMKNMGLSATRGRPTSCQSSKVINSKSAYIDFGTVPKRSHTLSPCTMTCLKLSLWPMVTVANVAEMRSPRTMSTTIQQRLVMAFQKAMTMM
mmetsp:Transcript_3114/g.10405  ORF Transcript_3114/g.10405 Transcript_3114/m.10405 type:complete len:238 (+) Transcript_3114:454-1167(+)